MGKNVLVSTLLVAAMTAAVADGEPESNEGAYAKTVLSDGPVLYYRLGDTSGATVRNHAASADAAQFDGRVVKVTLGEPGPRPAPGDAGHIDFRPDNTAGGFDGGDSRIVVADPGEGSALDFTNGDSITIEAWVNPTGSVHDNANVYVIGKGRTGNKGFAGSNQNWSLRLRGEGGTARISFLFRGAANKDTNDWHRWTSNLGFYPDTGWHHVAVTYTFGKPDSVRGYVDGEPTSGKWDMGGKTDAAPVVDDDEVWVGAGNAGSASNAFVGYLDEVALYRKALSRKQIDRHYHFIQPEVKIVTPDIPKDRVLVELMENVPEGKWNFPRPQPVESYTADAFGFVDLPRKYTTDGIIDDRNEVVLMRAWAMVDLPAGEHQMLLRSLNGARLSVDGKVVVTNRFLRANGSAHEHVPELDGKVDNNRMLPAGHTESTFTLRSDGGAHLFKLELHVGGKRLRPEVGETALAIRKGDGMYYVLSPRSDVTAPLTDSGWTAYDRDRRAALAQLDADRRSVIAQKHAEYWHKRHELARKELGATPGPKAPHVKNTDAVHNDIDRFIGARLEKEGVEPAKLVGDHAFLRRVTLDTVGVPPTPAEIKAFFADPAETRRDRAIERLLNDPRWADHWTGYWQDVLAENPGILKPMLNNTGPFRYWIHESLLDNKPMDKFVTELVLMRGSKYFGGTKGFEMASQNDVPMAAKAHIVGQAFLGVEMACARCHDAPYHDVKQADLFSLAAMLKRGPQQVPKSSSIPLSKEAIEQMLVDVTLKPGSKVAPAWPFPDMLDGDPADVPALFVRNPKDSRDKLAALVTWHRNKRFGQVIANRVWARFIGFGMIEPVDDWQDAEASHPQLLEWLGRELVMNGYDVKHIARLILKSHTYQRAVEADKCEPYDDYHHLFASPMRRRMTAEQVADSLFATSGKPMGSELLTLDVDLRKAENTFLNLGKPTRAWQFTSLSNERDRPSLSMPRAQAVIDVLKAFGWRESRQNPLTDRPDEATVQQPAILANGVVTRRVAALSDDSAFTKLALTATSPERFVDDVFLRILTRKPTAAERELFVGLIGDGFAKRIDTTFKPSDKKSSKRLAVSWSNHLSPEANRIKIEMEREVLRGDPPTKRLHADWRERAEDMVWALINSPEFVHIP